MVSREKIRALFTQESIIAYFLGIVVLWFGCGEIFNTVAWVGFAPEFLGTGSLAYALVIIHGVILAAAGLMLIFNFYRRFAAWVLVLVFAEIVIDLMVQQIPADLIIRDFGLWGMAVALSVKRQ